MPRRLLTPSSRKQAADGANLADARTTEKKSQEAFEKFMKIKEEAFKKMDESYNEKQKGLGGNDESSATKKNQLDEAQKLKASERSSCRSCCLSAQTRPRNCHKKLQRANEEAAIAEAISILNSDDAFATFGGASATSSGFLQLRSVHRHTSGNMDARSKVKDVWEQAAKSTKSARLSKVLAKLQAENPFDTVG